MNEIMGTTLFENGRWLLRHEGGGGNKVPLMGSKEIFSKLKNDAPVIFEGFYSRDQGGNVIAANVQSIKATRQ